MKLTIIYLLAGMLLVTGISVSSRQKLSEENIALANYIKKEAQVFDSTAKALETAVIKLSNDSTSIHNTKLALIACRLQYKRIAFFLEYFFPSEAIVYNAAPKYEIEEPYMEYQSPCGLQVIESLFFEKVIDKKSLVQQAQLVASSAHDISSLLYQFSCNGSQVMESIQLELIRIMTLYITGYDAPALKTGIIESREAIHSMKNVAMLYFHIDERDSIAVSLNNVEKDLSSATDFNDFNRLAFLTKTALPLQRLLSLYSREKHFEFRLAKVLNLQAGDLFSRNALNISSFSTKPGDTSQLLAALGEKLFSDKTLSGNSTRSCATCHQPLKYFTDGLVRNSTLNGHDKLARNTPGLFYAAYQYSQFWDGHAASLEAQADSVLTSRLEMDANRDSVSNRLAAQKYYAECFTKLWPGVSITADKVPVALAAYLRTLAPFRSAFDRYMNGDSTALSPTQQSGFNVFMGKAQCGTCHFAPLFNGLTPPFYQRTEYEVLGLTANDQFAKPLPDKDEGRYNFFPISFYKYAFKTPGIRNAAVTAPYMHNGAFKNMESVIDFYDKGGGSGLGLQIEGQTLSSAPLNLNPYEKKALIAFMESLTDDMP